MLSVLAANWPLLLVRGVLALVFGLLALLMPPPLTLAALVILFGAYSFVDGVVALVVAVGMRGQRGFGSMLLVGLAGIAAGVITFFYPAVTAIALLAVIAGWAIVTGVLQIAAAIALRKELTGEWRLALAGVLSVVFGVLMALNPAAGALAFVWLIAFYALFFGIVLIVLAARLRHLTRTVPAL